MFINNMFYHYENIVNKLFCCIIMFFIMLQSFFVPMSINADKIVTDELSAQNDIFSAVFVVEKTINDFACSVVGNIFQKNSKEKNETQKPVTPPTGNEPSILSVTQFSKTINNQLNFSLSVTGFFAGNFYFHEYDVGFIDNIKSFTIYFLEMLLKYSFGSKYGDSVIINNNYRCFFINPA